VNGSSFGRVLLIRLREIGDVVFTTPAIRALRTHLPHAHISYLVEPLAAPVVALNPCVDEVLVAPRSRLASDLALGRRLRAKHFDLVVDFHCGPRASLLTWLSGAAVRVGYDVSGRAWMYTTRVDRPRTLRPRHAVDNQWDLLDAIGIPGRAAAFAAEMPVDRDAAASVASRLSAAGIGSTDRIIVMHVSAGNPFRRWPQASFARVAAAMVSAHRDVRILVTSGPSEHQAAAAVVELARQQASGDSAPRVAAMDELPLTELRALFDRAALFVGGDSGPLHIASTSTVPVVALYGPTLPVRSAPWRDRTLVSEAVEPGDLPCRPCDQRTCVPGDFRCLSGISPDAVVAAAERALLGGRQLKMAT
jgi:ADP-heptose:LPS heptosyltransferase